MYFMTSLYPCAYIYLSDILFSNIVHVQTSNMYITALTIYLLYNSTSRANYPRYLYILPFTFLSVLFCISVCPEYSKIIHIQEIYTSVWYTVFQFDC